MRAILSAFALLAAWVAAGPAPALEGPVNIRPDLPSVTVPTPDGPVVISREQDNHNELVGDWALTSRPCPPFCIQPMQVAPGVTTIGELELLDMLRDPEIMVIDSRKYRWFRGGSIPGAVNIPYDEIIDRMDEFGCEPGFDGWECETPKTLALFCNGPWCGQSPTAIRNLIEAGYPPEKLFYYRGGMQVWRMLGLTVTDPR